jgi:hypothetical protein
MNLKNEDDILTHVTSSRGGKLAIFRGYIYNHDRTNSEVSHWRCRNRKCRGRIDSVGSKVIKESMHNHQPNYDEVNTVVFNSEIKNSVYQTPYQSYAILNTVLNSCKKKTKSQLK